MPWRSALWSAACLAWTFIPGARGALVPFVAMAALAFGAHFVAAPELGLSRLAVNDYKGASYARRLPEAKREFESHSPFGLLEAYTTSYLHFAPGLSDNAGFNLPTMPANAYMGLYIDSDGPIGVMRHLDREESAYFRFLPMYYPYVIKKTPKIFITQFGGGISTEVALSTGSKDITVAEGNRAILAAFRDFSGEPQRLELPSAPQPAIVYHDAPNRPQPRLDVERGGGMVTHVGRLRSCPVLNHKFVLLSHNTIRGAAGAAILNAELMAAKNIVA